MLFNARPRVKLDKFYTTQKSKYRLLKIFRKVRGTLKICNKNSYKSQVNGSSENSWQSCFKKLCITFNKRIILINEVFRHAVMKFIKIPKIPTRTTTFKLIGPRTAQRTRGQKSHHPYTIGTFYRFVPLQRPLPYQLYRFP